MDRQKIAQKVGILGGGQLGKMLCQAGSKLALSLHVLDQDSSFPAASVCSQFTNGSITDFDDVLSFGKEMDILTIEIENVNENALLSLEKMGKKVYPQPHVLSLIKDKGLQKTFYQEQNIATSPFQLFLGKNQILAALIEGAIRIPFVQKSRSEGYDGRGVHIVRTEDDLAELLDVPCLVENQVSIDKEIAVIVARNASGEKEIFQAVEMKFHQTANLVEYLFCPAEVTAEQSLAAEKMAQDIAEKLGIIGLLAVEMFIDHDGHLLVNEVAPRPHNSGHHTIEACETSQYEMHLRAILDLPLGSSRLIRPAVMVNLLGEMGYSGPVKYSGIETCLAQSGVYPHIYGKKDTKPFRKMGHVTVVADTLGQAIEKANLVQKSLKVIA